MKDFFRRAVRRTDSKVLTLPLAYFLFVVGALLIFREPDSPPLTTKSTETGSSDFTVKVSGTEAHFTSPSVGLMCICFGVVIAVLVIAGRMTSKWPTIEFKRGNTSLKMMLDPGQVEEEFITKLIASATDSSIAPPAPLPGQTAQLPDNQGQ